MNDIMLSHGRVTETGRMAGKPGHAADEIETYRM